MTTPFRIFDPHLRPCLQRRTFESAVSGIKVSGNLCGSTLSLACVIHRGCSASVYLHVQEQLGVTVGP